MKVEVKTISLMLSESSSEFTFWDCSKTEFDCKSRHECATMLMFSHSSEKLANEAVLFQLTLKTQKDQPQGGKPTAYSQRLTTYCRHMTQSTSMQNALLKSPNSSDLPKWLLTNIQNSSGKRHFDITLYLQ